MISEKTKRTLKAAPVIAGITLGLGWAMAAGKVCYVTLQDLNKGDSKAEVEEVWKNSLRYNKGISHYVIKSLRPGVDLAYYLYDRK